MPSLIEAPYYYTVDALWFSIVIRTGRCCVPGHLRSCSGGCHAYAKCAGIFFPIKYLLPWLWRADEACGDNAGDVSAEGGCDHISVRWLQVW